MTFCAPTTLDPPLTGSTSAWPAPACTAVPDAPGRSLRQALAALVDSGHLGDLPIKAIAAHARRIVVNVPEAVDVTRWATALNIPTDLIMCGRKAEFGVAVTGFRATFCGWDLNVQHATTTHPGGHQ